MSAPDLKALRLGDADAWAQAFRWLWPTAFAVAQLKLEPFLPRDIEDVAIESLEELVEELKPLTASI